LAAFLNHQVWDNGNLLPRSSPNVRGKKKRTQKKRAFVSIALAPPIASKGAQKEKALCTDRMANFLGVSINATFSQTRRKWNATAASEMRVLLAYTL
jgi:hypothetical protein